MGAQRCARPASSSGTGLECWAGVGACAREGRTECSGQDILCDATPAAAPGQAAELCDGLDNDCDGQTDEGDGTLSVGDACDDGVGLCRREGTIACSGLSGDFTCNVAAGVAQPEVCDGLDNDCDDSTDEGLGLGEPCSVGVGACIRIGVTTCQAGQAAGCSAAPGQPSDEVSCDNSDNDCDGQIDEGFGIGNSCEIDSSNGPCPFMGTVACSGVGYTTCDGPPQHEIYTESLCDNIDNDCDGDIDEADSDIMSCP